jgi:plastocyanin
LKTKYIYFLIAALLVAVAVYPVIYSTLSSSGAANNNPFYCAPLIPCTKQPPGTIVCVTSCTVIIQDSSYSPGTINASVGATIHWINKDGFAHTVTSLNSTAFNSGMIPPGHSYMLTISSSMTPGIYYYHCNVHADMVGLLNVIPAKSMS